MERFIRAMAVYDVGSPKVRIGPLGDGGYVVNELLLEKSSHLITLGVGGDVAFEVDWLSRTKTTAELYDGTYPNPFVGHADEERVLYTQRNVGDADTEVPLKNILFGKRDALLKIDVEGVEYQLLDKVNLENISGLILEVHNLYDDAAQNKLFEFLTGPRFASLVLIHVHGNNWAPVQPIEIPVVGQSEPFRFDLPWVMELTFVSRRLLGNGCIPLDTSSFPNPNVDAPNKHGEPDYALPWVNNIKMLG